VTVKKLVVAVKRNGIAKRKCNTIGNKWDKHWNYKESQQNFERV